jgi:carboxypeptidase T
MNIHRSANEGGLIMKSAMAIICVVLVLVSMHADSQAAESKRSVLLRTRISKELTQGEIVARGIDILCVHPDGKVDLAATEEQLEWLRSKQTLISILERADQTVALALDENLGLYHTYDETVAFLEQLASLYPELTRLDTLGTSIEGRHIISIKISDNADIDEEEPELLIMGCHHARELMTVEVPLYLAEYLLTNYGSNPSVTDLVDGREVWIAPLINPDGHVYVQNNHDGPWWDWWRKNRRDNGDGTYGVDLNRNYGYMWGYDNVGSSPVTSNELYRGTEPFSEPETQAVRDFCSEHNFSLSLSYHSYGELILYPWGYTYELTDDDELFSVLADSMNVGLGYSPSTGASLYITNGDSDDWLYGETATKGQIYAFTVEMNTYDEGGFGPPEELIVPTCEKLLDLNLAFLRLAEDPYRILGPEPPLMYDVVELAAPSYLLGWSGGAPSDPNMAINWELVEFKDIAGLTDSCGAGDSLWTLEGFSVSADRAAAGAQSYYSGLGNNLKNTMEMATLYPLSLGETLYCWLWYDIEDKWDYAYLEASLDQGYSWITVPGNRTTNSDPNGTNRGNGITGGSVDWVPAEFYFDDIGLTPGDIALLRFTYITDGAVYEEGIYIDMIDPTASSDRHTVLASASPDTFFAVTPEELGVYYYRVRGRDSDGQYSRWSNVVTHTVTDLTPAHTPAVRTALAQNYPNPFNPTTTIRFSVGGADAGGANATRVILELYDVAGRRVALLKDEILPSGLYSVAWDGTNDRGETVVSGVYFVRLVIGTHMFSRKMVLLR